MSDGKARPPHPATVAQRKAPHPTVAQRKAPHPAVAQPRAPHPAVAQRKAPHPATVQTTAPHPATTAQRKAAHPATVMQMKAPHTTAGARPPHPATGGPRPPHDPFGRRSIQRSTSTSTGDEDVIKKLAGQRVMSPEQATTFWKTVEKSARDNEIIKYFYKAALQESKGKPEEIVDPGAMASLMRDVLMDMGGLEAECDDAFGLLLGIYEYVLGSVQSTESEQVVSAKEIPSKFRTHLKAIRELVEDMPTQAYAEEESALMLVQIDSYIESAPPELRELLTARIQPVNRSASESSFVQVLRNSGGGDEMTCNQEARIWLLESIGYYMGEKKR